MTLTDFIIVYFTGGAPFAVYYFLQNRYRERDNFSRLKNLLVFLFWMPYAVSLFLQKQNRRRFFKLISLGRVFEKNSSAEKIQARQKQIENFLFDSDSEISLFDFRETFERYIGLTRAVEIDAQGDTGREFFRAAENKNVKLAAVCLHRRNRNKLIRHQTEARQDFLHIVERLAGSISDTPKLAQAASEIAGILNDDTALESLEKLFDVPLQTGKLLSVKYTEKDLWKPQDRPPLRPETISTR